MAKVNGHSGGSNPPASQEDVGRVERLRQSNPTFAKLSPSPTQEMDYKTNPMGTDFERFTQDLRKKHQEREKEINGQRFDFTGDQKLTDFDSAIFPTADSTNQIEAGLVNPDSEKSLMDPEIGRKPTKEELRSSAAEETLTASLKMDADKKTNPSSVGGINGAPTVSATPTPTGSK